MLAVLVAVLGLCAPAVGGRRPLPVLAASVGLIALALGIAGPERATDPGSPAILPDGTRILYETNTLYHHLRVEERGDSRFLRFDASWQSGMYLDDPVAAASAHGTAEHHPGGDDG